MAWEDKLSPIMRERLARIGDMTPEEKTRIRDLEELGVILSEFYRGDIDSEGLWRRLREYKDKGKVYLLKEAQIKLLDTLSATSAPVEFKRRKDGILAVESLKDEQNMAVVEQAMAAIDGLQTRRRSEFEQAYNSMRARVERNPQMRMQQIKQGKKTIVVQLTVDEAIKVSPEWKNLVAQQDRVYGEEFVRSVQQVKAVLA
ncbi:MAG: hypothetical protein IBX68_02600 [Dehalococcoidia bacterium]|nr:hypothetical protein [Dehalococcoidia bacterium]